MVTKPKDEQTDDAPKVKKGKPTWRPAAKLDVESKLHGYRLRWVDKDPMNVRKKSDEGWVPVNGTNGKVEHVQTDDISDGKSLDTVTQYKEVVLMALPEELGLARDQYFEEKTKRQTAGRANDMANKVGNQFSHLVTASGRLDGQEL